LWLTVANNSSGVFSHRRFKFAPPQPLTVICCYGGVFHLIYYKSLNYIIMKAKTTQVLDFNSSELLFGVKIMVNNRRAIFVAKDKKILALQTKIEAQKEADEINRYLTTHPEIEKVFVENKYIKVAQF
jgi:hypothetical protein